MKLYAILSPLATALLTLGTPTVAHTIEEAYHNAKLLTETCSASKAKLCAIRPGHTEGGGLVCIYLRDCGCLIIVIHPPFAS